MHWMENAETENIKFKQNAPVRQNKSISKE